VKRSTLNFQRGDRKGAWWVEYGDRHGVTVTPIAGLFMKLLWRHYWQCQCFPSGLSREVFAGDEVAPDISQRGAAAAE